MIRQFSLINAAGQVYDLMDKNHYFNAPDGLGDSRDIESQNLGGYFSIGSDTQDQATISGEMVFASYKEYFDFVNKFALNRQMTLQYTAYKTYKRSVYMESIDKSEIDPDTGRLLCDVSFLCLSPWQAEKIFYITPAPEGAGKTYQYTYPYTYKDNQTGTITIDNTDGEESPAIIEIFGVATNPQWILRTSGKEIASGQVFCDIEAGQKLVINSDPRELSIKLMTTAGVLVEDLYQSSNFLTERFIYIPAGVIAQLQIINSSPGEINADIRVKKTNGTV